jgi:hypothetical protein
MKINEDETQAISFLRLRPPEVHLPLNRRPIPFVSHVKYLAVILYKRIIRRLHIEMVQTKTFRSFIRIHSLFKSQP